MTQIKILWNVADVAIFITILSLVPLSSGISLFVVLVLNIQGRIIAGASADTSEDITAAIGSGK